VLNGKEFNRYRLEVANDAGARTAVRTLHARSDLNRGPVSNEFERSLPLGQRAADDEMIVAMNRNAGHRNIMSGDGEQLGSLAGYTGSGICSLLPSGNMRS
jgi:hypothetical protein